MKNRSENIDGLKRGRKIAFIATAAAFLLAVMKGTVGYLFDSEVLIADAFHSGADVLSNFAAGFGLWLASGKKSTKFPYGLYKAETMAGFVIGGFIILAAIGVFMEGFQKLLTLNPVSGFPILPVSASVISSLTAFFIAKKQLSVGREIGSRSLIANSKEAFLDIFTSLIVLTGIVLAFWRVPYVEGSIIMLVAVLILKLGAENFWASLMVLMDANLDPQLQTEIEKKVNEIYGVKGVSEVKIRQSGPFKMVECVIATMPSLSLYKAHELADRVETFIGENYEHIESVFIHVEPAKEETVSAIIPVRNMDGLESKVHSHFARAPYFAILHLENGLIKLDDFYYNEFLSEKMHMGVKIARIITDNKIGMLFTCNIGEIAFHMLKANFVDIYRVEENRSLNEVFEIYRNGRIQPLQAPTHSAEESLVGV